MDKELLFTETQRFRQWWLWLVLFGADAIIILAVLNETTNGRPLTEQLPEAEIVLICVIAPVLSAAFVLIPRLETRIDLEGIHIKFFPFHLSYRHFRWSDIADYQVRQYKPLGEYGGWGIRFGFGRGKAYNVSGNMGLQLCFTNGKELLIGTNKPEEIKEALHRLKPEKGTVTV